MDDTLLGVAYPVELLQPCSVEENGTEYHWFPVGAKPGDRCNCGQRQCGRPLRSSFDSRRVATKESAA